MRTLPISKKLREEYYAYWRVECGLVDDIIHARWRVYRVLATGTAALDVEMDCQREAINRDFVKVDEATRTALDFSSLAGEGRALRPIDRATGQLLALKSHKEQNEPGDAQLPQNQYPIAA